MAYLSTAEYVARAGNAETIRITDETRTQTIDLTKVERAISDAEEFAEAYIGGRYTLPLVDVPQILVSAVYALARENLHKTRPVEEVTNAADRARALLKDISAGRAALPIDEGQVAPVATGGNAYSSGDGQRQIFTEDTLAGYNSFGSPGYGAACWRS